MMERDTLEGNWNLTYLGSSTLFLVFAIFVSYLVSSSHWISPILIAVTAGLILGISTRIKYNTQSSYFLKPFSEFLGMLAGFLLIVSFLIFFSLSFSMILETIEHVASETPQQLVSLVVLPILGYSMILIGLFFSSISSLLISSEQIDSTKSIGVQNKDYLFPIVIGVLTILVVLGTNFIQDLPISDIISWIIVILTGNSIFSSLKSGALIFITYLVAKNAWDLLSIARILEDFTSFYNRLPLTRLNTKLVVLFCLAVVLESFINLPILNYLAIFDTTEFRNSLLFITAISLGLIGFVRFLRLVTVERQKLKNYLPFIIFGFLAYFIAVIFSAILGYIVSFLPEIIENILRVLEDTIGVVSIVMILMTISSISVIFLKSLINFLKKFRILNSGLENITLLSGGIFLSSTGFYLYNPNQTVLFIGITASLIIWSLGKRFVLLGKEIGKEGSTKQFELFSIVSLGIVGFISFLLSELFLLYVNQALIPLISERTSFVVFLLSIISLGLLTIFLSKHSRN